MQGGTITSGRRCTRAVVGAYWMSSIRSLRKTTLPGVTARLRPTANARSSLIVMRPRRASSARLATPRMRLAPSVDSARFNASGLVAMKLVGASASTYCFVRNTRRCRSGSGSGASVAASPRYSPEQQVALLHQRKVRQLPPLARGETAIAGRAARHLGQRLLRKPARGGRGDRRGPQRLPARPVFLVERGEPLDVDGTGWRKGRQREIGDAAQQRLTREFGRGLRVPPRPFLGEGVPLRGELARRGRHGTRSRSAIKARAPRARARSRRSPARSATAASRSRSAPAAGAGWG